jgi:hypothetical protein
VPAVRGPGVGGLVDDLDELRWDALHRESLGHGPRRCECYACWRCRDAGWLCEAHPTEPFEHANDPGTFVPSSKPPGDLGVGCPGPGVPCPSCNATLPQRAYQPHP